jgi:maltose alpha-D-glucosyltransferase/alpha-amylase
LEQSLELAVVGLEFADGQRSRYFLPLAECFDPPEGSGIERLPNGAWVADAVRLPEALEPLVRFLDVQGRQDGLVALRTSAPSEGEMRPLRVGSLEQSNSAFFLGEGGFAKVFRRLPEGTSPDWEIGRFLAGSKARVPATLQGLLLEGLAEEPLVLVQVWQQVAGGSDAWAHSQTLLSELLAPGVPSELAGEEPAVGWCRQLGVRTGELHRALVGDASTPAFVPEALSESFLETAASKSQALGCAALDQLEGSLAKLEEPEAELARQVLSHREAVLERLGTAPSVDPSALRIRCHGDYHLGQVLWKGGDAVILDFEGEPARPLAERRLPQSPLKDVAGMLRSFDYAAQAALKANGGCRETALRWRDAASQAFLSGYLAAVMGTPLVPSDAAEFRALLDFHVAEKLLYELHYELGHRPDWVAIPLQGLWSLAA